ncbi:MAG: nucleotidyl transferase AbiEii/AbiGii toxin family protein, partial [Gammaproteobacteria bacterium]|nr:nucleotidyl transferase AbiEii/AbiGii toxin family protein [Gammaproteobacteria bacterium]
MQNKTEILEQIEAVSTLLKLPAYVVEKDLYATQAISIVTEVKHDNFDLIFQGGTSLAKAHRVILRMSEDCDFRIRAHNAEPLSKEGKRRLLRKFRRNLVNNLQESGFNIVNEETRVRNEGRFMSVRARYSSAFLPTTGIKPYLALEFFLGDIKTPCETKPVTTLIQQVLGDKVHHPVSQVDSITVVETAAEKWVALTRRIATMKYHNHYRDESLVRHIYDLYQIEKAGLFTKQFEALAPKIVMTDREIYRNHNEAYYCNPAREIKKALDELKTNPEWQDNWDRFISTMVYDKKKPTYKKAIDNLQAKSEKALHELSK